MIIIELYCNNFLVIPCYPVDLFFFFKLVFLSSIQQSLRFFIYFLSGLYNLYQVLTLYLLLRL